MGAKLPTLVASQRCLLAPQHRTDQLRRRESPFGGSVADLDAINAGDWACGDPAKAATAQQAMLMALFSQKAALNAAAGGNIQTDVSSEHWLTVGRS